MSPSDQHRVRLVVHSGPSGIRQWEADAVHALVAVPGVTLVGWTISPAAAAPADPWLYRRWCARHAPPGWALVPLAGLPFTPAQRPERPDALPPTDVVLDLTDGPLTIAVPRLGIWRFERAGAGSGMPGLWELLHERPVHAAQLVRTDPEGRRYLLHGARFPLDSDDPAGTAAAILHEMVHWPVRAACQFLLDGPPALFGPEPEPPSPHATPPSNWRMLGLPVVRRTLRHRPKPKVEWNIGVLYQPMHALLDPHGSLNIRYLPAPAPDTHRMGPAGYLDAQGRINVLYRKLLADGRSELARVRPKQDNVIKRSRTMLGPEADPDSASTVTIDGTVWVVVGSTSHGRVDLYVVDEANEGLVFVRTLLNEPLEAVTVFRHAGRWWLFGTRRPFAAAALHAWWSDTIEGPWRPHALNPLKIDPASARPGGTPFVHEGVLWRPAQDRSKPDAPQVVLNQVHLLDPHRFSETPTHTVVPRSSSSYPHGIGTLHGIGHLTLVDGMRRQEGLHTKPPRRTPRRKRSRRKS